MPTHAVAAVLREPGGLYALEEVLLADPRGDEVLVQLTAAGVCHTDLVSGATAHQAQLPMVYGHEGIGTVRAVGDDVTTVRPGDRVILSYSWCGSCGNCRNDQMAYCANFLALNNFGVRLDGTSAMSRNGEPIAAHFFGQSSFATHSVTTERNVVKVAADAAGLADELLAPLGCGVQTGAGSVLNALAPRPGSSIAVFGAGAVGLSAVLAAKIAGCADIVVVEPHAARRQLARDLGATHAIDPRDGDAAAAIVALTGGVDHSVECVGLPEVIEAAVGCLRTPGMCITVGFQGLQNPVRLDQIALMLGRGIRGCIEGDSVPWRFIPELVSYQLGGRLPVDRLVTTFAFEQINEAVAAAHDGSVIKPVLTFPGG